MYWAFWIEFILQVMQYKDKSLVSNHPVISEINNTEIHLIGFQCFYMVQYCWATLEIVI